MHRVYVDRLELTQLQSGWPASVKSKLQGETEFDHRGVPMGVRIVASRSEAGREVLGFKVGDLITAAGTRHLRSVEELETVLEELAERRQASATLVRDGRPHKILYYLGRN